MCRITKSNSSRSKTQRDAESTRRRNNTLLRELCHWFAPQDELFSKKQFHGNTKWNPEQLVTQALIWSWQETKLVTDAFDHALEICDDLGLRKVAKSYTSMMNSLARYQHVFAHRLRDRFQALAKEVGGQRFETYGWVPIGLDGSRTTAPRSISNEQSYCAPNYGRSRNAKYRRKKWKGLRRRRSKQNPPQPQAPQVWVTLMWHMGLRLPWTWRIGPTSSSERAHVQDMLTEEKYPPNTLFCGDAGFTGYSLWSHFSRNRQHFLVRVGGNVRLLKKHAKVKKLSGGSVICWPRAKVDSGEPPLRLRLVQVKVGKTKIWMLTNVLAPRQLTKKQIARLYEMRWGIEVEFRGLKQTVDKDILRCRNPTRLYVELDWAIRAMAVAELLALREQVRDARDGDEKEQKYDPIERSLANTMRALRKCMRNLHKYSTAANNLLQALADAKVQQYDNRTDKRARYRPPSPDKNPLGEPIVRDLNPHEVKMLSQHDYALA